LTAFRTEKVSYAGGSVGRGGDVFVGDGTTAELPDVEAAGTLFVAFAPGLVS